MSGIKRVSLSGQFSILLQMESDINLDAVVVCLLLLLLLVLLLLLGQ